MNERPFEDLVDPRRFWVTRCLVRGGEIVGYGHLERFREAEKAHVARLGIIISPEIRGQGFGTRLMKDLRARARERGIAKVWLSVHRENVRAVRLYESVGFRCEGLFEDEERDAGGSRDVVSMSWFPDRASRAEETGQIPWTQPAVQTEEMIEVIKVLQSGWITQGRATDAFERRLAGFLGVEHVVAFNSGTSALLAAYRAAFQPGDRVLFPTYAFVSTLSTAILCGIEPLLVDSEARTGNIDLDQAEALLTGAPNVRGLVVVDVAGLPCDLARCRALSERVGLILVEDAAQALGATVGRGRKVGSLGHLTTFSFHAAKLVTCGEGGAVAVSDERIARVLRKIRNHGESTEHKFVWESFGLNLRLTDLQAGIGLAQLAKVGQFQSRRDEIAGLYRERLQGLVEFQDVPGYVGRHAWTLCLARVEASARLEIQRRLQREGITTRPSWMPVHRQPVFAERFKGAWPVAEEWGARGLCLPIANTMRLVEAERVAEAVTRAMTELDPAR